MAQAAHELAQAAPLVLILAFDREETAMIPLEAAAKNADFGAELVPVARWNNLSHGLGVTDKCGTVGPGGTLEYGETMRNYENIILVGGIATPRKI